MIKIVNGVAVELSPDEIAGIEAWRAVEASKLPEREEEIKRRLLAEAVIKRDSFLGHLRWFYTKAVEEAEAAVGQSEIAAAIAKRNAIDQTINSMQNIFNDQRVIIAIDGQVRPALDAINEEILARLAQASPGTYASILALDPL